MLEPMDAFFQARIADYDRHMLTAIEGADLFYPRTAALLPQHPGAVILDLGCGTGLELEPYFSGNPTAQVTGIDLCPTMLERLAAKFPTHALRLICGSYFDVDFGIQAYDAAVSVESLHHFTEDQKLPLYRKVHAALKPNGYFVLTDYFAESDAQEAQAQKELATLKRQHPLSDSEFYHYDTPLTVAHEVAILQTAGFTNVTIQDHWGATHTLFARR